MKKYLPFVLIAVAFASCKKDVGDAASPRISLSSPNNHQTYTGGQVSTVTATITDDNEIHAVHLYVNNKSTGAEIVHMEEHLDMKSYNLQKTFTVQAGVTYTIKIEATDHAENESEVQIEVSGN